MFNHNTYPRSLRSLAQRFFHPNQLNEVNEAMEELQPVPQINSIVRRGCIFGRCDSEPRTDVFPDSKPRIYVVALNGSWAQWWQLDEIKLVPAALKLA